MIAQKKLNPKQIRRNGTSLARIIYFHKPSMLYTPASSLGETRSKTAFPDEQQKLRIASFRLLMPKKSAQKKMVLHEMAKNYGVEAPGYDDGNAQANMVNMRQRW